MTTPTPDFSSLVPTKWKAWVGLATGVLAIAVPYILDVAVYLPDPWPLIIGLVIAVLGALGVHKVPYAPPGAVLAPDTPAVAQATAQSLPPTGGYRNPWQQQ